MSLSQFLAILNVPGTAIGAAFVSLVGIFGFFKGWWVAGFIYRASEKRARIAERRVRLWQRLYLAAIRVANRIGPDIPGLDPELELQLEEDE